MQPRGTSVVPDRRRASRTAWADVLPATLIAGAAPLGRMLALYDGPRLLLAVVALIALGVSVAWRPVGVSKWPRDGIIFVLVGTVGVLGAAPAAAMTDPSIRASSLVLMWTAGSTALAMWTVGELNLPVVGHFDRRVLGPVVGLSVLAGILARSPDRLAIAIAMSVLAAASCLFDRRALPTVVTLAIAATIVARDAERLSSALALVVLAAVSGIAGTRHADLLESWSRSVRQFLRDCATTGPLALRLGAGAGLLWWMASVRFWMVGLVRSDEIWYAAWYTGFSAAEQWIQTAFGVLGLMAIAAGVLTVGALVTIRGAVILREVFRWVAAATAIAVVATLVIEWVF